MDPLVFLTDKINQFFLGCPQFFPIAGQQAYIAALQNQGFGERQANTA
jgi:molecular chaperone DnaK (HSP70)